MRTRELITLFGALLCHSLAFPPSAIAVDPIDWPPAGEVDTDRLARHGLRVLRSEHCVLVTDLARSPAIDELPRVVDSAVPQWEARFGGAERANPWRVRVCLIGDTTPFEAAGLMPVGRPFENGLALGHEVWFHEQPSDYYRRCLLLHEATHSYMMCMLGGCGPGWYMEGMAELLAAHRWDAAGGRVELGVIPADKRESPLWGRVKVIRDAAAGGDLATTAAILKLDNRTRASVEEYAWAWALAFFCDRHPRYQTAWRRLPLHVLDDDFDARFSEGLGAATPRFNQEWRAYLTTLDYGHDVAREAIDFREGRPLEGEATAASIAVECDIAADRGWQSTGVRVERGRSYQIGASGRWVIHRDPDGTPWPCEAPGVTLAYHRGRPLGRLLATVDSGADAFTRGEPVGGDPRYTPDRSGTLYLRVNDAPNRLAENEGGLTFRIAAD